MLSDVRSSHSIRPWFYVLHGDVACAMLSIHCYFLHATGRLVMGACLCEYLCLCGVRGVEVRGRRFVVVHFGPRGD